MPVRPIKGRLLKDTTHSAEWMLRFYDALKEVQETLFPGGDRRKPRPPGGAAGEFYSAKITGSGDGSVGTTWRMTADIYATGDCSGDASAEGVELVILGGLSEDLPDGTVVFPAMEMTVDDGEDETETLWTGTWQGVFV